MICSIIDGSTSLETGKAPEVGRDEEVFLGSLSSAASQTD